MLTTASALLPVLLSNDLLGCLCSWPLPNVWIYSGSVDVVFVLEEYADEAAERDPFCCLELICGQCELKTEQHFEVCYTSFVCSTT